MQKITNIKLQNTPQKTYSIKWLWTLSLNPIIENEMIIIGGRPGHGKSTLMRNIATIFSQQSIRVGIYSLEMTSKEVANCFSKPSLCENILIDDNSNITIADIENDMKNDIYDIAMIDYVQLMRGNTKKISMELKRLTNQYKKPIFALVQLNRSVETNKGVRASAIKDCGALEQDANRIWLIDEKGWIHIVKNRGGATGVVEAEFIKNMGVFIQSQKYLKLINEINKNAV